MPQQNPLPSLPGEPLGARPRWDGGQGQPSDPCMVLAPLQDHPTHHQWARSRGMWLLHSLGAGQALPVLGRRRRMGR